MYGVLARRNAILVLMAVELMLNAVNLNLVAFDAWLRDELLAGQVFTLFVIVIAAAEIGLGLAIVLLVFRHRETTAVDELRRARERSRRGAGAVTPVYIALLAPALAALLGLLGGRQWPRLVVPVRDRRHDGGAGVRPCVLVARRSPAPSRSSRNGSRAAQLGSVPTGLVDLGLDLRVDGLRRARRHWWSTVVALAVQVYSTAYLNGDPRYSSYAALVSLFTAAMLLVVFADDLFVLLVGWEVMGVCSYLLIGHHWEQEAAPSAARQGVPHHPAR